MVLGKTDKIPSFSEQRKTATARETWCGEGSRVHVGMVYVGGQGEPR